MSSIISTPHVHATFTEKVGKFQVVDEHQCVCVVNAPVTNAGARSQENLGNIINSLVCDAEDIAPGERGELRELLHWFSDVISVSVTDIGRTDMVQHSIDIQNSKPIKQGPRRLPFHRRQEVKQLLDSMLENDIIEPADGPWASPIVLVTKKDGSTSFCVVPFGLCNAPSTFQRLMELVLTGLHWSSCLVYLDDIIIYSRSVKEHVTKLAEVLRRLKQAGMKLKPKKCRLLQKKVSYLGYVVSSDGIQQTRKRLTVY